MTNKNRLYYRYLLAFVAGKGPDLLTTSDKSMGDLLFRLVIRKHLLELPFSYFYRCAKHEKFAI